MDGAVVESIGDAIVDDRTVIACMLKLVGEDRAFKEIDLAGAPSGGCVFSGSSPTIGNLSTILEADHPGPAD